MRRELHRIISGLNKYWETSIIRISTEDQKLNASNRYSAVGANRIVRHNAHSICTSLSVLNSSRPNLLCNCSCIALTPTSIDIQQERNRNTEF